MTTPPPAQKVLVLEDSIRCFVLGLLSLVPLLGAGCVLACWRASRRVRRASASGWNPASAYLRWGRALAVIGTLLTLGMVVLILLAVQDAMGI